ncbi:unnamed protein product [Haemonchus placei]|uniref:Helitron_like_N domain-containing protein n=1 Tax=Haemonchus placei TaxID=6290 RepID=A0A0N4W457_HAEPC|nr:unnamed protein product [Haemonchus placei]
MASGYEEQFTVFYPFLHYETMMMIHNRVVFAMADERRTFDVLRFVVADKKCFSIQLNKHGEYENQVLSRHSGRCAMQLAFIQSY